MRHRLALLMMAALLPAVAACGSSATTAGSASHTAASTPTGGANAGLSTVKVAVTPATFVAPLFVADAKGYFAAQGIKVDLQTVKTGGDAIPLAASGKIDVIVGGFSAGLFSAIHSGLAIKVVGTLEGKQSYADRKAAAPTALEVARTLTDSGKVKTPADLRGRRVALAGGPGGAAGYLLDSILRQNGLTLHDITPVNLAFPDMQAALKNGGVDAAIPPAPFTTLIEASGAGVTLAIPPVGTAATGIIYGGPFVKNPAAKKFYTALQKGAADLQGAGSSSEQTLQILAKYTGQTVDVLRKTPLYTWDPDLAPRPDQLLAQQQTYLDAGLLTYKQPLAASTFIDPSFATQ